MTQGKNLFNKLTAIVGYYIDSGGGAIFASSSYCVTDYIPVTSNTQYICNDININIVYYDSNKIRIGGANAVALPITTPVNTSYVKYSFKKVLLDTMQFEVGTISTNFEEYCFTLDSTIKYVFDINNIPDNGITNEKLQMLIPSRNLFDMSTAQIGKIYIG